MQGVVIRKTGREWRLYSRKADPRTGRRRVLGRFGSREDALKRERQIQYFKHKGH
jgi:hypothetical protein